MMKAVKTNSRRLLIVPKTTLCRPSHRFTGWFAAMLLAVVAGSSLALFAVLTKAVVDAAGAGFGSLLDTAEFYFWIPAALLGMIFQQSSFRAGSLTASLPTSVVAKPVVGSILGIAVLGETLHAGGARKFVLVTGVVLVFIATVALVRDEAATMSTEAVEQTVEEALRRRRRGRTAAAKPPPRMLRLSGRRRIGSGTPQLGCEAASSAGEIALSEFLSGFSAVGSYAGAAMITTIRLAFRASRL